MRHSRSRRAMPRKRLGDLAIVIVALALVIVLAALRESRQTAQQSEPSTYDTGANGYAALYDLLSREGGRVARFELPIGEISNAHATLVLAGERALAAVAPSASTLAFLDRWIRGGGKLVILDGAPSRAAAHALRLPEVRRFGVQTRAAAGCAFSRALRGAAVAGKFTAGYAPACRSNRATVFAVKSLAAGIAYSRGRGSIVLVSTPSVFDNLHLAQHQNARVAYALLGGAGTVLFDERVHGYAAGRTFWEVLPQPMRVAMLLALAAALLAIIGANLPFAPPYEAQAPEERDSAAYIASVARMLQRGGAAREAIARIGERCAQVLSAWPGDERARMLLRELHALESTPRPGAQDVLHAGRIFARVRKEYGC